MRGLDPERIYVLSDVDEHGVTKRSGRELMEAGLAGQGYGKKGRAK